MPTIADQHFGSSGMDGFLLENDQFITSSSTGTMRTRRLDDALEILWGLRQAAGVTRISSIAGQDRIGLPIFNAARPNACAQNLTVATGKGTTSVSSLVSCLAEAYERHWAEPVHISPHSLTATELDLSNAGLDFVSINTVIGYPIVPKSSTESFDWTLAFDVTAGSDIAAPLDLIVAPYPSRYLSGASDGIACGNCRSEAFVHAVLELIERDATSFARFAGLGKNVAIESVPSNLGDIIDRIAVLGIATTIVRCESLLEIPVYYVVLDDQVQRDPMMICAGAGAHPDPTVALSRALTEAIQTRACVISGNREDLGAKYVQLRHSGYNVVSAGIKDWVESFPNEQFDSSPHSSLGCGPAETARSLVSMLEPLGHKLYCKLLSPPEAPMKVVTVFGVGFESAEAIGGIAGPRLRYEMNKRWAK